MVHRLPDFFYWIVIRPIHACCRELDDAKNRERGLKPQGSYELQCLISAFNKSISQIQDKKKEIADIQMVDPVTGGYTATRFDLEVGEIPTGREKVCAGIHGYPAGFKG